MKGQVLYTIRNFPRTFAKMLGIFAQQLKVCSNESGNDDARQFFPFSKVNFRCRPDSNSYERVHNLAEILDVEYIPRAKATLSDHKAEYVLTHISFGRG